MIVFLIVFVPLLILFLWMFFKSSPNHIEPKKIKIYNYSTIVLGVLLCVTYSLKIKTDMAGGSDSAWWPILAIMFSLVMFSGLLLVSAIIRKFLIFRK